MIDMDYTDIKWQQLLADGYFLTAENCEQIITVHMPVNGVCMQRFGLTVENRQAENVDVHLFENFTELYETMRRFVPMMDWQAQWMGSSSERAGEVGTAG